MRPFISRVPAKGFCFQLQMSSRFASSGRASKRTFAKPLSSQRFTLLSEGGLGAFVIFTHGTRKLISVGEPAAHTSRVAAVSGRASLPSLTTHFLPEASRTFHFTE